VRHVLDDLSVFGHVFADASIAAGSGAFQHPITVHEGQRQPVDLKFGHVLWGVDPLQPLVEFFLVEYVIEAEHAFQVLHVLER
jgi:hypothetical protein